MKNYALGFFVSVSGYLEGNKKLNLKSSNHGTPHSPKHIPSHSWGHFFHSV